MTRHIAIATAVLALTAVAARAQIHHLAPHTWALVSSAPCARTVTTPSSGAHYIALACAVGQDALYQYPLPDTLSTYRYTLEAQWLRTGTDTASMCIRTQAVVVPSGTASWDTATWQTTTDVLLAPTTAHQSVYSTIASAAQLRTPDGAACTASCARRVLRIRMSRIACNSACSASGVPFACCTGSGTGTCTDNADAWLMVGGVLSLQ